MDLAVAPNVRTGAFTALSFRFAIHSDDSSLGDHLVDLLAGLRDVSDDESCLHTYSLTTMPQGVDVWRDEYLVASGLDRDAVASWVLWDLNRSAAHASGHHLLFHAAALESRCGGVLLPGPSGSGKSTLSSALATTGMGYLSDELVALDMESGQLLPYPKPISIKPGSFELLSHLDPAGQSRGERRAPGAGGDEWQVAVAGQTGLPVGSRCRPRLVVAPRFTAGAETALKLMTETEAFFVLAANTLNLGEHGSLGTESLAAVVGRCSGLELVFSDLTDACQMILELVRGCAS